MKEQGKVASLESLPLLQSFHPVSEDSGKGWMKIKIEVAEFKYFAHQNNRLDSREYYAKWKHGRKDILVVQTWHERWLVANVFFNVDGSYSPNWCSQPEVELDDTEKTAIIANARALFDLQPPEYIAEHKAFFASL